MKRRWAVKTQVITASRDPDVCATVGCHGEAVLTHLGRPRCQRCWDEECALERDALANPVPNGDHEESDMARKSTKSGAKTATKTTVGAKAAALKAKVTKADGAPKRISALDAAATVLKKRGEAMRSQEMIAAMAEQGLWSSPNGKTPHATLYAAILREISVKGKDARFSKVERGKFEYAGS